MLGLALFGAALISVVIFVSSNDEDSGSGVSDLIEDTRQE